MKAGKYDDNSSGGSNNSSALAVYNNTDNNNTMVAVRNGSSVKVFKEESGEKLFKCKLESSSNGVEGTAWLCLSEKYVVCNTSHNQVQIYSTGEGKLVSSIITENNDDVIQVALQKNDVDGIVLVNRSLYKISSTPNKKTKKVVLLTPSTTLPPNNNKDDDNTNYHLADFVTGEEEDKIHIVIQTPGRPVEVVKVPFLQKDSKILLKHLILPKEEEEDEEDDAISNKRSAIITLGAGQAGQESMTVSDRPKKKSKSTTTEEEEEEEDPTVAQRLKQLQEQFDKDDDDNKAANNSNKIATTESVSHLLHQGLKSSDEKFLEIVLATVKDNKIRSSSIDDLTQEEATVFLNKLTARLSRKPQRAFKLVPWITALLQSGKITTVEPIVPLQNMIRERIAVFPQLLQLDGRLTLLTSTTTTSMQ
eukprot:CAMPEP_0194145748 /NCGR_PEP_ID=MMETSP0152-20130528/18810_1 /TAXON_ID=1049557 /ORGANISM="Thalassiothrix antarctica, Strain L6-D1" /LENGTH=419 /DNA_ID=CAMNT_0038846081 /DNA_START=451 /DNA_END=1710 /DNA_ORIENTATION=-